MKQLTKYKAISLSSGAARGIYQLGVMHAAQVKGLLDEVKIYAGTSIGSIIALLLAVGWNAIDIFTHICTDDIVGYIDTTIDIQSALKHWGVFDVTILRKYIHKMIVSKYGGVPTFKQLYDETGKIFICTSYKVKSAEPRVYFNYLTHPNMSVLEAMMLSSNIPFLFKAANYDGDYYLDGGCFELNPANYVVENFMKDNQNDKLLSVSLDLRDTNEPTAVIDGLFSYIKEIVFLPMYAQLPVKSTSQIDAMNLNTQDSASELQVNVTNKTKIKWFCAGLEQGLAFVTNEK